MKAAEILQEYGSQCCTDVTGFGLIGHLTEMIKGSNRVSKIQDIDLSSKYTTTEKAGASNTKNKESSSILVEDH